MTDSRGRPLYLAEQVREIDRRTIAAGVEGFALMQQAAMAAYDAMRKTWPTLRRISVCCGSGNNAGDGYVLAALAACDGLSVQVIALRDPQELDGDAGQAVAMARRAGLKFQPWQPNMRISGELIVDALLGTGLSGAVREPFSAAIDAINAAQLPVLAVDIPSGLSADSGAVLGRAVKADLTVTFIADKLGLHTGSASAYVGTHRLEALGVEASRQADIEPCAMLLDEMLIPRCLPPRARDAHKGDNGHLLVIGGAPGFGGAALLASETAARLGAGKVSLATAPAHVTASLVRCPEVMVHGINSKGELEALIEGADVLMVGPGIGKGAWGQAMLQAALASDKPLVVDADGLNLLTTHWPLEYRDNWILTPHPGEAARLLESSAGEVQQDRRQAITELRRRRGGAIVLKGAGTLVADQEGIAVCPFGNPGMASGGMGDALSGMLGALLAQGLSLDEAARVGVLLHALAADRAVAAAGERGLLASDLASYARFLSNPGLSNPILNNPGTSDAYNPEE
ncbi:NAD(P)H-hydrate dehydratase [Pistricoccus aurantiacus]|uniref:Bifunctional NAD(P)H-hydrate repair enzyme n=1 Tax=Pistricoccus aurantiacus TaxID=1883414 RepID=A0A5B8STU4_9GAMM|nr:NAD(P)H-hydrate dehydratase [Pistricoccus aurantiacus]QEA40499.1 NAD(P)H-hydrate dehydratase [Pistricoccus aurantiacus]